MKKIKTTIALAGLVTMGAVVLSQPAFAAPQTTNANVQINPGTLTFTAPTTMEFNSVTVNGSALSSTEKTPATISVNDLRGANTGWSLTAKIDAFQNNGITLSMTPAKKAGTNPVGEVATATTLNTTAKSIAKVIDVNMSKSWLATDVIPTAKLTIPATVKTGKYTATITWDLNEGPTV
ncbi:WxL domain-containing protein [Enterococcus faecalis]|uniref:WxL domain-containing protein n=1 Tax=Enterococcus faecalis TaxID=1351 RepID=UPI002FBF11A1